MIGRNPDAGGHALHQGEPIAHAGAALSQAKAVMILLHGRGASADGILSLAEAFADPEIAYFAPQAAGHMSSASPSGIAGSITTRGMAFKPRDAAIGGIRNEHPRCGRCDRPAHRRLSPS